MGLFRAGNKEGSHHANRLEAPTSAGHKAEVGVAAAAGAEDGREAEVESAMIVGEMETTRHGIRVERVGELYSYFCTYRCPCCLHSQIIG